MEVDGVADGIIGLHDGGYGGDVVHRVDECLQGVEVVVGGLLPLLEGGDALLQSVHLVPQPGVVIVIARGEAQGSKDNQNINVC